jgi:putative copper export protein
MSFFATANHWVHLTSVVFWMGGLAFQLFVMAPFTVSDNPPPAYLTALSNRFNKFVGPIILVLIATGGVNIGFRRAGHDALPPGYISMLGMKVFLVASIASIHFFGMIRSQLDDRTHLNQPPALPRLGYAKLSFALGILIIFIASMLRQWKF